MYILLHTCSLTVNVCKVLTSEIWEVICLIFCCYIKGEIPFKKPMFLSTLTKTTSRSPEFQPLMCRFSLWKLIRLQGSAKFQHTCSCCHFEQYSAARPHFRDVILSKKFCPKASDKPFNQHSGLHVWLSHIIILSQTCSKLRSDSIKDSEVDNCLKK